MNKRYFLFFVTILFALISACGNEKTSEDIFTDVAERQDEVEDYKIGIDLQVIITNEETEDVLQSSQALMDSEHFEASANSHGTLQSINDDVEETIEYYNVDNLTYANINEQGWEESTDGKLVTDDDATDYKAIAKLVTDLEDELDVQTEGDYYVLTFQGQSESVYKAFETPYSLTLSGVTPAGVEHDVEIKVNQDTMLVEHVKNTITGANEGLKIEMSIDHTYDKINQVEEIEIPQDVIDEAH